MLNFKENILTDDFAINAYVEKVISLLSECPTTTDMAKYNALKDRDTKIEQCYEKDKEGNRVRRGYFYTGCAFDVETTTPKQTLLKKGSETYIVDGENLIYRGKKIPYNRDAFCDFGEFEKPLFSYVYHTQFMVCGMYFVARTMEMFMRFVHRLATSMKVFERTVNNGKKDVHVMPHLLCYIANLNHEWSFMRGYIDDEEVTKHFAKGATEPLSIVYHNAIEFRECLGVFGYSLEKVAKTYCKTKKMKGDLDYSLLRNSQTELTDKEKTYCYNDVKILDELCYVAFDMYECKGKPIPMTQTGIIRGMCKEAVQQGGKRKLKGLFGMMCAENYKLMPYAETKKTITRGKNAGKEKIVREADKAKYLQWREFLYQGGYSHSNIIYTNTVYEGVTCCDVTSDYPHQLNARYFPAGKIVHMDLTVDEDYKKAVSIIDDYGNVEKRQHCAIFQLHIISLKPRTTHSFISQSKVMNWEEVDRQRNGIDFAPSACIVDNGRLLSGSDLVIMANEVDIANLKALYETEFVIVDCWYFTQRKKCPQAMLDVMNELYHKKNVLKKEIKVAKAKGVSAEFLEDMDKEYVRLKQLINSVYGMFGTRIYTDTTIIENGEFVRVSEEEHAEKTGEAYKTFDEKCKKQVFNPYIAYWCTSYARATLVRFIAEYPNTILQYDTDSLYFHTIPNEFCSQEEIEGLRKAIDSYNEKTLLNNNYRYKGDENMADLGTFEIDDPSIRFKCLGAKRYVYEYWDKDANGDKVKKVKPVIAGCNKKAFIEYCEKTNSDPFEFFRNHLTLSLSWSKKTSCAYRKDKTPIYETVTDYQGHTEKVEIRTYCAIYQIPFSMSFKEQWFDTKIETIKYMAKFEKDLSACHLLDDLLKSSACGENWGDSTLIKTGKKKRYPYTRKSETR